MKNFFLFLATGVMTALPVLYLFAGAWMGVPIIPTEYASIFGSGLVMAAAFVALFSLRKSATLAIIGIIGIGSFWIIEPIKALQSSGSSAVFLLLLGSVWLAIALSLSTAIKALRITTHKPASSRQRKVILGCSSALLFILVAAIIWQDKVDERIPSRYEIPDGYVGWIEIQHEIPETAVTPIRDKQLIFVIPESGLLKTRTAQQFGTAQDHYFYCGNNGCREIANTGWGKGGMIWGESSGTFEETGKPEIRVEHFFVGNETQYKKMQELSAMQEGIVPGDIKSKL